jgi:hypothetical protein
MKKLTRAPARFLICVNNKGDTVSLEKRKIYLASPETTPPTMVRSVPSTNPAKIPSIRKVSSCPLQVPNLFGKPLSTRRSTGRRSWEV